MEAGLKSDLLVVGNPENGKFYFKSMVIRRPTKRMLVFLLKDPKNPDGAPFNRMLVDFNSK